jgi:hypothetical protein
MSSGTFEKRGEGICWKYGDVFKKKSEDELDCISIKNQDKKNESKNPILFHLFVFIFRFLYVSFEL